MKTTTLLLTSALLGLFTSFAAHSGDVDSAKYLSIAGLESPPEDPSNYLQKDQDAVRLGELLFFDTEMSSTGQVACASCHFTEGKYIANESLPAGKSRSFRSVMQVNGVAYNRFFFWDGRADSLWAQALGPIQNPDEHNFDRLGAVAYVARKYSDRMEIIAFKSKKYHRHLKIVKKWLSSGNSTEPPSESINFVFTLIGKSLAAFQTSLPVQPAPWDEVAQAKITGHTLDIEQERIWRGFKVFNGKGGCSNCHDGPLFTDFSFHNTAMPSQPELGIEAGRYDVLPAIKENEFGCYSPYSDADKDNCRHLEYINQSLDMNFGAFKTPTLRDVGSKVRLGHSSQFASLEEIIDHYDKAPAGVHGRMLNTRSLSELKPLGLTKAEKEYLITFLHAL
mgnify:FL=1